MGLLYYYYVPTPSSPSPPAGVPGRPSAPLGRGSAPSRDVRSDVIAAHAHTHAAHLLQLLAAASAGRKRNELQLSAPPQLLSELHGLQVTRFAAVYKGKVA